MRAGDTQNQQTMPKLANKAFSAKFTQIMHFERHKEPYNTESWTYNIMRYVAASVATDRHTHTERP